jgi:hypothetical protein
MNTGNTIFIGAIVAALLYFSLTFSSENYCLDDKENINNSIQKAYSKYNQDLSKYNIGAKTYEYDFIDNQQPLTGLSPDFKQNYPSTLNKENKMFVEPDLSINYVNLLNTRNNSLKNYINM